MDLWQLTIFCRVIEQQSFSRAGALVRLSQSTVSSHIKSLEAQLGCRLVDRLVREARPTPAGRLLYDYALKLLALRDEAVGALQTFHETISGKLAIGGSTIPGGYMLPQTVAQFTARYPQVQITLNIDDSRGIIEAVESGKIEMGVVGARGSSKSIVQEEIAHDEMRLIVAADHPWAGRRSVSLSMLLREPLVVRERGSGTRKALEAGLDQHGLVLTEMPIAAVMGSTEAVRQAVKCGSGISIFSTRAVTDELAQGRLSALAVEGLDLQRSFYLTYHRHRTPIPACRRFIDYIRSYDFN